MEQTLRVRNRDEVAWARVPVKKKAEARPAPRNERELKVSQALYGQPPRRSDRLILEN